jgi:GR25 family glycosyltransferase involved in LPS biosynthesis
MVSVDTCLILNLDERVDLWDGLVDFREQWEKTGKKWHRIPGIDYRNKSNVLNEMILNNRINLNGSGFRQTKEAFLGELGCFMGHYNCWKYVVDHGLDACLILEDGIELLRRDFKNLVANSDILFVNEEMQMVGARQFVGYGTQGYIVTQKGAEFLLKNCYTLSVPIDLQIRHLCNTANISANVVFPPYVRRNNTRISSIGMNVDDANDLNKKQNQNSIIQRLLTNFMQLNLNLDDFV